MSHYKPFNIQGNMIIPMEETTSGIKPRNDLQDLLIHCEQYNFSDIHFQTGRMSHIDIEGAKHDLLDRPLMAQEMEDIVNGLYRRSSAANLIAKGQPVDSAYDFRTSDKKMRYRYRFNGSGELNNGCDGMQITVRRLPSTPPTADQLGLKQEDIDDFIYDNGLVVISGQTGSGKTSTLAAVVGYTLEHMPNNKIVTAEAPIEFVFDNVIRNRTMISQAEVGRHIDSFAAALRSALRRKPEIILVGEARDLETIDAAMEAATTGHLVWTTNHANGAAATVQRMIMGFNHNVQALKMATLCSVMRMCISQTLVKGINGKRLALREKLPFTHDVRHTLTGQVSEKILNAAQTALIDYGRPMIMDAQDAFQAGKIDQETVDHIARNYGDKIRSQAVGH